MVAAFLISNINSPYLPQTPHLYPIPIPHDPYFNTTHPSSCSHCQDKLRIIGKFLFSKLVVWNWTWAIAIMQTDAAGIQEAVAWQAPPWCAWKCDSAIAPGIQFSTRNDGKGIPKVYVALNVYCIDLRRLHEVIVATRREHRKVPLCVLSS